MLPPTTVHRLSPHDLRRRLPDLAGIMHACVHAGASVGFVLPFTHADSEAWWRGTVLPALERDERVLLVAETDGRLLATGQLIVAQMPNQRHKAEVSKVLVHPDQRRRGLGRAIMHALEVEALNHGKTLLTLDTRTGDAGEPLYASMGFQVAGSIPGYCLHPFTQALESTTYMFKPIG